MIALVLAIFVDRTPGWAAEPVAGAAKVQQVLLEETGVPEPAPAAGAALALPGSCGPSPLRVITKCEVGAGFLCVNTPPGGTTEAQVTMTGLIDRVNHTFAGLTAAVQHDQTKVVHELDVRDAVAADGSFRVVVPLSQLGSYTVVFQALRAHGDPAIERVTVSRVIAPRAHIAQATVTPDPADTGGTIVAPSVMLHVDLLPHCEQCDYVGSTTGATLITVHNIITQSSGSTQRIERTTDLGADGKFSLCIPVGNGTNHLEISACNAATGFALAQCAQLSPIEFAGHDGSVRVVLDEPQLDQQSLFDQRTHEKLPIRFRVEGIDESTQCLHAVTITWNREAPQPLCPSPDGRYEAIVQPAVGINVGVITVQGKTSTLEYPLTVGWGTIQSPWDHNGAPIADDARWETATLAVGVRRGFLAETVRTLFNHVAQSDQLATVLQQLVDRPPSQPTPASAERATRLAAIRETIPTCQAGGAVAGVRLQLVEPPHIGSLEITRVAFREDTMEFDVVANQVSVRVKLDRDANGDGVADGIAIPLRIAFERLALYPMIRLVRGRDPVVLLTAATTNCDYQDDDYCSERPAVIVPQHFVGAATTAGGFVVCDHEGQQVEAAVAEGCHALNRVNAQTGLLSAQVLSAMNEMLYCTGSSLLTHWLRDGARHLHLAAGCVPPGQSDPQAISVRLPSGDCTDPRNPLHDRGYDLPLGFDLVQSAMHLGAAGMSARVASRVGTAAYFQELPAALRTHRVGYVTEGTSPTPPGDVGPTGSRDIALGVSETLLNQLFFMLGVQGDSRRGTGLLDWDLHPQFFEQIGFDMARACDQFDPQTRDAENPPALCQLRPRVKEIFGNVLSTAEYFPPNHPLMLRLRGSRRLMPSVHFFRTKVPDQLAEDGGVLSWRDAQFIDLQIPDLDVAIYALQIDPSAGLDAYGNPHMWLDAQGTPLIHSMRPELADPLAGPIVRARLTLRLPLEIEGLRPRPTDPSRLEFAFRTNSDLTQLVFSITPGDNATIIPDGSLLSNLREKLLTGLSRFTSARDAIRVTIPKQITISPQAATWWSRMAGIHALRLAKDGLALGIDPGQDYVTVGANLSLTQRLVIGGELIEWMIPEE